VDDLTGAQVLTTIGITATKTELNYVDGATGAIQDQLDHKLVNVVEDTTPQLGGDLDMNAKSIQMTVTKPGSDHTYSGIVGSHGVAETVAFGDLLYFDCSEKEYKKSSADVIGTMPACSIALEAKTATGTCKMLFYGVIRDDSWSWTVDDSVKVLYASTTTGAMQTAALSGSGDYAQVVGIILRTGTILFNPSYAMAKVT